MAKFISQDSAFLAVGDAELAEIMNIPKQDEEDTDVKALRILLSDPQMMNSYAYARNNPIILEDKTGKYIVFGPAAAGIIKAAFDIATLSLTGIAAYDAKTVIFDHPNQFSQQEKFNAGAQLLAYPSLKLFGVVFSTATERAALDVFTTTLELVDIMKTAPSAIRQISTDLQNQAKNLKSTLSTADNPVKPQEINNKP